MTVAQSSGVTLGAGISPGDLVVRRLRALGQTQAGSLTLPANAQILDIIVKNSTANAVTGGIKFGTTAGGVDIVAALAVGGSAFTSPVADLILLRVFSASAAQTIYFDAVAAWNSANVDITIIYVQL